MKIFNWRFLKLKRLKLLLACSIIYLIYVLSITIYNAFTKWNMKRSQKYCYDDEISDGIPDILNHPPQGKSIFFIETSCGICEDNFLQLSARQACAVESAAKHNPNSTVYLLYAAPTKFPSVHLLKLEKHGVLNALLKYTNVKIRRVLFETFTQNTLLESWYQSGKLRKSEFLTEHGSDILRLLTLWRFGGTYLDLDTVTMRNLDRLSTNYAGAESDYIVANGVLNFNLENGRAIVYSCLKEILNNFRGDYWGHNGPGLLTRVLKKICKVQTTNQMTPERCKGFRVYEQKYFYPINYTDWQLYFDPDNLATTLNTIKNSFIIHIWNNLSKYNYIFTKQEDVAFSAVARNNCPCVFSASGEIF